ITYKLPVVRTALASAQTTTLKLMVLGIEIGLVIQVLRVAMKRSRTYQAWKERSAVTKSADFVLDTIVLPGPYASSLGGFVEFPTALWYGVGGVFSSVWGWFTQRFSKRKDDVAPADMD